MPNQAVLCQHFRSLSNAFGAQADQLQKVIEDVLKDLDGTMVGKYRDDFLDAMKKAENTDERIAAAEAAAAKLLGDQEKLFKKAMKAHAGGAPIDPWFSRAQQLLHNLAALLRALKGLRALQADMDGFAKAWCG